MEILGMSTPRRAGVASFVRLNILLVWVIVFGIGCSQQAAVPPPSADANDILKNSDGTIGPMKGTPGN
jgi:hypothetical protein